MKKILIVTIFVLSVGSALYAAESRSGFASLWGIGLEGTIRFDSFGNNSLTGATGAIRNFPSSFWKISLKIPTEAIPFTMGIGFFEFGGIFGFNTYFDFTVYRKAFTSWFQVYLGPGIEASLWGPKDTLGEDAAAGFFSALYREVFTSLFQVYLSPELESSLGFPKDTLREGVAARFFTAFSFVPIEMLEIYVQPVVKIGIISQGDEYFNFAMGFDLSLGTRYLF